MDATQIKANDQQTVAKVVNAGHQIVKYGLQVDRKARWSVYLTVCHRNDTKRLMPTSVILDAWMHDAQSAKAYARIMKKHAEQLKAGA